MINKLKARNSENEALKGEIAELRNSIAKKAGTKKGAKLLQNDKVVKAIYTWFKDGPFRNNKFFLNDKHRDQWVEAAWEQLKDSLSLEQAPTNLDWDAERKNIFEVCSPPLHKSVPAWLLISCVRSSSDQASFMQQQRRRTTLGKYFLKPLQLRLLQWKL